MSTSSIRRSAVRVRPFVATVAQEVLAFLAQNAQRAFYDREVATETGLSRGAVNTALRALAGSGLLVLEQRGRMKFYRASLEDARVRSLKLLLNVAALAPLVKRVAGVAMRVVLFGSAAEGRNVAESDIDLMVVTNEPERVRRLLAKHSRVQAVVVTPAGLAELEEREPVFAAQVRRGVELWKA